MTQDRRITDRRPDYPLQWDDQAAASQSQAVPSELASLDISKIIQLLDENTDRDFGLLIEPFARAIEKEVQSLLSHSAAKGESSELVRRLRSIATDPMYADYVHAKKSTLLAAADEIDRLSHSAATGKVPEGWTIEEVEGEVRVKKAGQSGIVPRRNGETAAEQILFDLATAMLAASPAAPLAGKAELVATCWAIYYDNLGEQPYKSGFMTPFEPWESEEDAQAAIDKWTHAKHYRPMPVYVYAAPLASAVPAEEAKNGEDGYVCPAGKTQALAPAEPAPVASAEEASDEHSVIAKLPDIHAKLMDAFKEGARHGASGGCTDAEASAVAVRMMHEWDLPDAPAEPAPILASACPLPPEGWACTRAPGHEGPCAAVPVNEDGYSEKEEAIYQRGVEDGKLVEGGMARLRAGSTPTAQGTAPSIDTPEFQAIANAMGLTNTERAEIVAHVQKRWDAYAQGVIKASEYLRTELDKARSHIAAQAPAGRDAIRDEALEEAAMVCDKSSVQPALAKMIRALKSHAAEQTSGGEHA